LIKIIIKERKERHLSELSSALKLISNTWKTKRLANDVSVVDLLKISSAIE
jgi:hypothetical protein